MKARAIILLAHTFSNKRPEIRNGSTTAFSIRGGGVSTVTSEQAGIVLALGYTFQGAAFIAAPKAMNSLESRSSDSITTAQSLTRKLGYSMFSTGLMSFLSVRGKTLPLLFEVCSLQWAYRYCRFFSRNTLARRCLDCLAALSFAVALLDCSRSPRGFFALLSPLVAELALLSFAFPRKSLAIITDKQYDIPYRDEEKLSVSVRAVSSFMVGMIIHSVCFWYGVEPTMALVLSSTPELLYFGWTLLSAGSSPFFDFTILLVFVSFNVLCLALSPAQSKALVLFGGYRFD